MKNERILAIIFLVVTSVCYLAYWQFSADTFNWYLLGACFLPVVAISLAVRQPKIVNDPVAKVVFDSDRMFVKNHQFEKGKINKVVIDLTDDYAVFALPYNQVKGRTIEFRFDRKRFGMFRQYIESNLPNARILT